MCGGSPVATGSPWGAGDQGKQFEDQYLPNVTRMTMAAEVLALGLAGIHERDGRRGGRPRRQRGTDPVDVQQERATPGASPAHRRGRSAVSVADEAKKTS
jgi:hypothetical protein